MVLQDWSGDRLHQLAARRGGQLHPVPRLAPPHRRDKVLAPGLRLPLTGPPIRETLALNSTMQTDLLSSQSSAAAAGRPKFATLGRPSRTQPGQYSYLVQ